MPAPVVLAAGAVSSVGTALATVLSWPTVGFMVAGLLLGMLLGALPGIGAAIGIVVLLPLTGALSPVDGLVMLTSMYSGGMYGSSISSILLNVPGTVSSAATTLDGYPMSEQGRGITALAISATSSALGGFLTVLVLVALVPYFVPIVLLFGSPEYTLVAVLGITLISVVARGSMVKGITTGAFGMLLSTVGAATVSPVFRFTHGYVNLYDGLSYVAALIGMFAIAEMIRVVGDKETIASEAVEVAGDRAEGVAAVARRPVTLVKSAFIGMAIGLIPGSGASISNFVSYAEAVRSSDDPGSFGTGKEEGVIAAEAANNGTVGGSLVPTLSFGIPGSGTTAILLGAFLIHGLQPGPNLFTTQLELTYALFVALLVGNLLILVVGLGFITRLYYLTRIDIDYIVPVVVVLSVLGGYALRNNWIDVATVFVLGIAGYYMVSYDYPVIPFVLGTVLGPIAEENVFRSLQLSDGSFAIFVSEPLRLLLVAAVLLSLTAPLVRGLADPARRRFFGTPE